jgi:hypothetical protein
MRRAWIGVGLLAFAAAVAPASSAAATSLAPVHGLRATAVDGPGVKVSWRWPDSGSVTRAKIRYVLGSRPPRSSSSGDAAGFVKRGHHSLTVYGLLPESTYSFAVFAKGHGLTSARVTASVRTLDAPTVTSTSLPPGVVGTPYFAALTVSNSSSGSWAVESGGLPDGLALNDAHIVGTPTAAGTASIVFRYVDRHGATTYAGEWITISDPIPEA